MSVPSAKQQTTTVRSVQENKKPAEPKKNFFAKPGTPKREFTLLFDKENYMWAIAGFVLVFLGFYLMSGGKSANPHEFHYDEIYSFQRITLSPIVILIGYGVEIYAIMKRPKQASSENKQ